MFGYSSILIVYVAVGIVHACFSLLAIWVVIGRRPHWSLRCAALLATIALLLPIETHELAFYVLCQSAVIVGSLLTARSGWSLFRQWRTSDEGVNGLETTWPRVSLRDLFLAMALLSVAIVIAVAAGREFPFASWRQLPEVFLATSLVALTATLAVFSRGGFWVRVATGLIFLVTAAVAYGVALDHLGDWIGLLSLQTRGSQGVAAYSVFILAMLILWRVATFGPAQRQWRRVWARCASLVLVLIAALVLYPVGYVYWRMATPPAIPIVSTIESTGYAEIAALGRSLETIYIPEAKDGPDLHADFAAAHHTLIDKVRTALAKPVVVPIRYTEDYGDTDFDSIQGKRELARALAALARDAENRGARREAIDICCDIMTLGRAISDGQIIHFLVGNAIEGIGLDPLRRMRDSLTFGEREYLIAKLCESNNADRNLAACMDRERVGMMHAYGWRGRFQVIVQDWNGARAHNDRLLRNSLRRRLAFIRTLATTLAIDSFREATGELPASLDQLTPNYWCRALDDPFSSRPLVYKRTSKDHYLLYSVGYNRVDDGGVLVLNDGQVVPVTDGPPTLPESWLGIDLDEGDLFLDQWDWEED